MAWYTLTWLLWGAAFFLVEGRALFSRRSGATLSEHIWTWFRVLDPRPTARTWILRGVLLVVLGWLFLHLGFGWLTPTHPLPWR